VDWRRDSAGWPHAQRSTFERVRPHLWHVQQMGHGPDLVLLHGAGGATHSWRGLMPCLAEQFRVTAMDLPGHGFTRRGAMQRSSLPLMAEDTWRLLDHLDCTPTALIGHSAGGALALQMSITRSTPVFGINTALEDFSGVAGWLFPMMARFLAINPLTSSAISRMLRTSDVNGLLKGTGSTLDAEGVALYARCLSNADHIEGTLAMMSQWSLRGLRGRLDQITAPVHLLAGSADRTVAPATSERMASRMAHGTHETLTGLGHLAHEEAPEEVAARITAFVQHLPEASAPVQLRP
jgi:magnesium chelatase accessory protein